MRTISLLAVSGIAIAATLAAHAQSVNRGWTIVGAEMADGSGAPLRHANVRFVNDRIVAVGDVKPQKGDEVVDGKGLVVAPGFIDIHNHSSSGLADDPAAETQIAQGITTVVPGPTAILPGRSASTSPSDGANPRPSTSLRLSGMPPCDGR